MRKVCLIIVILIYGSLNAEVSVTTGFLNDNYTGSIENGVNGNYIGADDFLTFTLFANTKVDNITIDQYYHVVTSRKYNYRYDLLNTRFDYNIPVNEFIFRPFIGTLYKSNLGGEIVQNEFHSIRELPPLYEKYSSEELALELGLKGSYNLDFFKAEIDIEVPTDIKPISALFTGELIQEFYFVNINILGGYKQYINSISEYSEFVRSGLVFGGQVIVNFPANLSLNAGAFFFPVKNLENDPNYLNKSHDYSPQFWVSLGLSGYNFDLLDIVNF